MPHTIDDTKAFRRRDVYAQHAELVAMKNEIWRLGKKVAAHERRINRQKKANGAAKKKIAELSTQRQSTG